MCPRSGWNGWSRSTRCMSRVCEQCLLVQLEEYVTPEEIFTEYAYFSSYSDSWVAACARYVDMTIERFGLGAAEPRGRGRQQRRLPASVLRRAGVPGARDRARRPTSPRPPCERGDPRRSCAFFGARAADGARRRGHAAPTSSSANNVLAHVPDLNDFVGGIEDRPGAAAASSTMEFPHLLRLIEENQFDTIYHEHFSYFSFTDRAARSSRAHGLEVFDVEELPTHGGSLRIYARHDARPSSPCRRVGELARPRSAAPGSTTLDALPLLRRAGRGDQARAAGLPDRGSARRASASPGYGAPGKGNTLLNYCGIRTDFLDFTVDRNPYKQGQFLPGTHIPIRHPERLEQTRPDYILILPWNLKQEIVAQLAYAREWGAASLSRSPRWQSCYEGRDLLRRAGLRMQEASEVVPKPMIPIGSRPILWHVMKYYAHFGFNDFMLCLGYEAEAIKHFFLTYNEALANDFVLSDGGARVHLLKTDIHNWNITFVDTGLHVMHRRASARGAPPSPRRRDVPRQLRRHAHRRGPARDDRADEGGRRDRELPRGATELQLPRRLDGRGGIVDGISDVTRSDVWINGGYFVMRSELLDHLGPGEDLVEEPFSRLMQTNQLMAQRHDGFWAPMDTLKDKQSLEALHENGTAPWQVWDSGRQVDHDVAIAAAG